MSGKCRLRHLRCCMMSLHFGVAVLLFSCIMICCMQNVGAAAAFTVTTTRPSSVSHHFNTSRTRRISATSLYATRTKWTSLMKNVAGYRHDVTRYYAILGLQRNRDLSEHQIKSAYHKLVKLYHPGTQRAKDKCYTHTLLLFSEILYRRSHTPISTQIVPLFL